MGVENQLPADPRKERRKRMKCESLFIVEFLTEFDPGEKAEIIAREISKMARLDHGGISITGCEPIPSPRIVDLSAKLD